MSDFITCTEYAREPIFQFSTFNRNFAEIQSGLKSGELAAITGKAWQVSFDEPHECDCEHCTVKHDRESEFFTSEEDARKYMRSYKLINPHIDPDWYYIKAVRQNRTGLPILDMVAS